jgi:proteasome accessory factor C
MTERDVDPLLAFSAKGNWYLAAFDHKRGTERLFRVDRIKELARTGDTFAPPEGFDPARVADGPLFTPSPRDLEVTIDVGPHASWVREFVPFDSEVPLQEGWTRLSLRTSHLAWLVRLLLAAGPAVRAVAPAELVDAVIDATARALARYAGT